MAVVVGNSPIEKFWREEIARVVQPFANRVGFTWYNDLSFEQILKHASALPPQSAIFWELMIVDGVGVMHEEGKALAKLHAVANAPIFSYTDAFFGHEIVGGPHVPVLEHGQQVASVAFRILSGERPADIKTSPIGFAKPIFDWRQLQRWGISEKQLPPGSEIRFRELTAWERYRAQFVAVALVLLFQSALIAGLLYADRRRRAAETQSRELSGELAYLNRIATAGELAASIAHEIRQPLAAIVARGSAGLNWLKKTAPDLDKVRGALENIVDNGHRADQVLRNTRAMFGKGDTSTATLNVNKVIDEVLALVEDRMTEERIQFIENYDEMPAPVVRINRVELQQVLLNLTMNAIEAMSTMSRGDRVLKLTTEVTRIGRVLITVQDSGPGIALDQLDLIFKSFFTTKPAGMGLGLSISRTIVEAHGGQLTVAEGDPVGMVFTIDLPLRGEVPTGRDQPQADC